MEGPPFPDEVHYVWEWFVEHTLGLTQNGMGAPVVTWESLHAWQAGGGPILEYWESLALVRLGVIRANVQAEKQAQQQKQKASTP